MITKTQHQLLHDLHILQEGGFIAPPSDAEVSTIYTGDGEVNLPGVVTPRGIELLRFMEEGPETLYLSLDEVEILRRAVRLFAKYPPEKVKNDKPVQEAAWKTELLISEFLKSFKENHDDEVVISPMEIGTIREAVCVEMMTDLLKGISPDKAFFALGLPRKISSHLFGFVLKVDVKNGV